LPEDLDAPDEQDEKKPTGVVLAVQGIPFLEYGDLGLQGEAIENSPIRARKWWQLPEYHGKIRVCHRRPAPGEATYHTILAEERQAVDLVNGFLDGTDYVIMRGILRARVARGLGSPEVGGD
jgi:hypothetical protein